MFFATFVSEVMCVLFLLFTSLMISIWSTKDYIYFSNLKLWSLGVLPARFFTEFLCKLCYNYFKIEFHLFVSSKGKRWEAKRISQIQKDKRPKLSKVGKPAT